MTEEMYNIQSKEYFFTYIKWFIWNSQHSQTAIIEEMAYKKKW